MKKIIDGLRFDTDTATKIYNWDNGIYGNDFRCCEETLYKTKKGVYFLHGQGGPASEYSKRSGNNSMSSGSDIVVLSVDDAFAWLCSRDAYDQAEQEFPFMIDDA